MRLECSPLDLVLPCIGPLFLLESPSFQVSSVFCFWLYAIPSLTAAPVVDALFSISFLFRKSSLKQSPCDSSSPETRQRNQRRRLFLNQLLIFLTDGISQHRPSECFQKSD
eukprot:TRINITY_DN15888_c0_g5_i3.p1 TRINITY_DN15888_c0_g5~~TRINITY_DN15888_c0_g5_i3.p1  ORF type:complete len:111 (-),score=0.66 TRINITY_DN15888_c0_g5_i3:200-532(-)